MDTSMNSIVGKEEEGPQDQAEDLMGGNIQATEAPTVDDGCDKEISTAQASSIETTDGEQDLHRNDTEHDSALREAMSGNEPLIVDDESSSDDDYPRFADTYKGKIVRPVVGPKPSKPKPRQDDDEASS